MPYCRNCKLMHWELQQYCRQCSTWLGQSAFTKLPQKLQPTPSQGPQSTLPQRQQPVVYPNDPRNNSGTPEIFTMQQSGLKRLASQPPSRPGTTAIYGVVCLCGTFLNEVQLSQLSNCPNCKRLLM